MTLGLAELECRGVLRAALETAEAHNVSLEEIVGRTRKPRARALVARRAFWRRLHAAGWNCSAIGRLVGVHYTTVIEGVVSDEDRAIIQAKRRICREARKAAA